MQLVAEYLEGKVLELGEPELMLLGLMVHSLWLLLNSLDLLQKDQHKIQFAAGDDAKVKTQV